MSTQKPFEVQTLSPEIQDEIGKGAHANWKEWRISIGYPDHLYEQQRHEDGSNGPYYDCKVCQRDMGAHHADMVEWEDLKPEKRAKYIMQGLAGYGIGYREGVVAVVKAVSASLSEPPLQSS